MKITTILAIVACCALGVVMKDAVGDKWMYIYGFVVGQVTLMVAQIIGDL